MRSGDLDESSPSIDKSPPEEQNTFAAQLRGFGPLGILAILAVLGGNYFISLGVVIKNFMARNWIRAACQLEAPSCSRHCLRQRIQVPDEGRRDAPLRSPASQS